MIIIRAELEQLSIADASLVTHVSNALQPKLTNKKDDFVVTHLFQLMAAPTANYSAYMDEDNRTTNKTKKIIDKMAIRIHDISYNILRLSALRQSNWTLVCAFVCDDEHFH